MPVKVGASYVTEAAYEFAKARRAEREEGKEEKGKGVLKELKEKYPGLNIRQVSAKVCDGRGEQEQAL